MKSFVLRSWQFLLIGMAGWINRSQQEEIEYLRIENKVLRESGLQKTDSAER